MKNQGILVLLETAQRAVLVRALAKVRFFQKDGCGAGHILQPNSLKMSRWHVRKPVIAHCVAIQHSPATLSPFGRPNPMGQVCL